MKRLIVLVSSVALLWGCEGGCGCSSPAPTQSDIAANRAEPGRPAATPSKARPATPLPSLARPNTVPSPSPDAGPPAPSAATGIDASVGENPPSGNLDGGTTPIAVPGIGRNPKTYLDGGANNFAPPPLPIYLDASKPAPTGSQAVQPFADSGGSTAIPTMPVYLDASTPSAPSAMGDASAIMPFDFAIYADSAN